MALRIANKINRQFVKNVRRSLSTKRDITDLDLTSRNNDDISGETSHSNSPISPSNPVQYQVCQPRANRSGPSLVVNFASQRNAVKNETEVAKNAMAMQHLQPALLPEYYKPPVEINSSIYQDTTNEQEKQSSIKKARKFEESSTRLNLTRPLKAPKLANPFPEPVKVMPSHTVCDKEKAELMLAEQKMAARTVILPENHSSRQRHQHQQQHHHHDHQQQQPVLMKCQRRQYSTKGGSKRKCKNSKTSILCPDKSAKKCRKFKMPCCAPARIGGCTPRQISRAPCQKIFSPYPSFSERCGELPFIRPTECNSCPWKPWKHPTFKNNNKSFHTETDYFAPGTSKLEEEEFVKNLDADIINGNSVGYKLHKSIRCLEEKPPCKQKQDCEERRPKDEAEIRAKNKVKKDECKKPKKKCIELALGDQIGAWLQQQTMKKTPVMDNNEAQKIMSTKLHGFLQEAELAPIEEEPILLKDKPCPPNPCKKFPFKHDTFELVKEREPAPRHKPPYCPEKKHKLIKDCPAGPCGCYKNAPISNGFQELALSADISNGGGLVGPPSGGNAERIGYFLDNDSCKPKKPPCKKFEKPQCQPEEPEPEECDRGLHPRSAICPKDAGFELHYKRPKFIPKTDEEINRDRENRKNKKTKGFEEIPLVLPSAQTYIYPYMDISTP
ncbi:uncharacterized protein [Onthophagus taurus]|uniref:uncharacterized protein n=1 Tax=Onthophagus taurus TaxID=166361 RepID=UPI0039BE75A7